jgi:hypothetical protein
MNINHDEEDINIKENDLMRPQCSIPQKKKSRSSTQNKALLGKYSEHPFLHQREMEQSSLFNQPEVFFLFDISKKPVIN